MLYVWTVAKPVDSLRNGMKLNGFLLLTILSVMSGCSVSPTGLQAEYPQTERGWFDVWSKFVEVDSLQPTLRWQLFPRAQENDTKFGGPADRATNVTYELRVWKTVDESSGKLVYTRKGLVTPYHELEESLEQSTKYLWTIRAQFTLDGQQLISEWGLSSHLLRSHVVPNASCFRFITPTSK
jgi:hypothetical protein